MRGTYSEFEVHGFWAVVSAYFLVICSTTIDFLEEMPLAQGLVVGVTASIGLGTWMFSSLDSAVLVTGLLSTMIVFVFGIGALLLLRWDRRKHDNNILSLGIVLMMAANVLRLLEGAGDAAMVLQNLATTVIMIFLFTLAFRGYRNSPRGRQLCQKRK